MATLTNPLRVTYHRNKASNFRYDCDFCSEKFSSRVLRNEHILKHFETKSCLDCDKNLIRVGDDWYEIHSTTNCTKIKNEPNDVNSIEESWVEECLVKIEQPNGDVEKGIQSQNEIGTVNSGGEDEIKLKNEIEDKSNDSQEGFRDVAKRHPNKISNTELMTEEVEEGTSENELKCTILGCNKILGSKQSLEEHVSKHTGNMKYECEICGKKYPYSASLRNHKKTHKTNKFKCIYCKRTFKTNEDLITHSSVHSKQELLVCDICHESFTGAIGLKKHMEVHMEKTFKCTFAGCDRAFSIKKNLDEHISVHNGKNYVCKICGNRYPYQSSLHNHKRTHNIIKFKCIYCKKSFDTEYLLGDHTLVHHIFDTFICDICDAQFNKLCFLNMHMEIHREKQFKCSFDGCDKKFSKENALNDHINAHNGIKKYQCEICGKGYPYRASLVNHKMCHQNMPSKKYRCPFENCDKILPERSLRVHQLKHDPNAQRFQCEICEKIFLSKRQLAKHQTRHTKERKFECTCCGATFKTKNCLRNHENIHSKAKQFKCVECDKMFLQKGALHRHQLVHTGEKPYKCTVEDCAHAYANKVDLERHKYTAHGIFTKKFSCEICQEGFPEQKYLTKHMKIHNL